MFFVFSRPNQSFNQRKKSSGLSKKYEVKDDYINYAKKSDNDLLPNVLQQNLDEDTYKEKLHALLYLSEAFYRKEAFKKLKICNVAPRQFKKTENDNFKVSLGNQFGKNSYMKVGDSIHVKGMVSLQPVYEGYICKINYENNSIDVSLHQSFQTYRIGNQNFKITFKYFRTHFIRAHHAIDLVANQNRMGFLFPEIRNETTEINENITFCNTNLNNKQQLAVKGMLSYTENLPYILFGPPGTGKTVTLTEVIIQLFETIGNRLLVCAPSNKAVENLLSILCKSNKFKSKKPFIRFISPRRLQPNVPSGCCCSSDVSKALNKK